MGGGGWVGGALLFRFDHTRQWCGHLPVLYIACSGMLVIKGEQSGERKNVSMTQTNTFIMIFSIINHLYDSPMIHHTLGLFT